MADTKQLVLDYVRNHPGATYLEICGALSVTGNLDNSVVPILRQLVEAGQLAKLGSRISTDLSQYFAQKDLPPAAPSTGEELVQTLSETYHALLSLGWKPASECKPGTRVDMIEPGSAAIWCGVYGPDNQFWDGPEEDHLCNPILFRERKE